MNPPHAVDDYSSFIITGIRSYYPEIRVHGKDYKAIWSWNPWDAKDAIPKWAGSYLLHGRSVTEVKWARSTMGDKNTKIVAIVNCAAIVLDYAEKTLDFIVPVIHSHTVELLPDGFLAVATTGDTQNDGFDVYDMKGCVPSNHLTPMPKPVQRIKNFPVIHGLIFDHSSNLLWAAGNNKAPNNTQGPSHPVLQDYTFNNRPTTSEEGGPFDQNACHTFKVCEPAKLNVQWERTDFSSWWDGAHDLIPVPASGSDSGTLLITTDLDIFAFNTINIQEPKFQRGEDVISRYLPGFSPVGERTGSNGLSFPRSDVKALSINTTGNFLYVQSVWKDWFGKLVRVITREEPKTKHDIEVAQTVYVSRWFAPVPGWSGE